MKRVFLVLLAVSLVLFSGCPADNTGKPQKEGEPQQSTVATPPKDLYAVASNKKIELHWSAVEGEAGGYNVYRSLAPEPKKEDFLKINAEQAKETTYTDAGLVNDLTYYYAVTAVYADGKESGFSETTSAIPFSLIEPSDENKETPPVPQPTTFTKCDEEKSTVKKDLCLKDLALSTNNQQFCELIAELSVDECRYDLAVASNNSLLCEKIPDSGKKNDCLQKVAASLKSLESCLFIPVEDENTGNRDSCIYDLAVEKSNHALCKGIEKLSKKDECYSVIGKSLDSYVICGMVSTSRVKEGFKRDFCYLDVLNSTKDKSICPLFLEDQNMVYCYTLIAEDKKDISVCNEMPSGQDTINNCYKGVAEADLNAEECHLIVDDVNLTQKCIEAVSSSTTATYELCNQIYNYVEKNDCFYRAGTDNNNVQACTRMSDRPRRNNCVQQVALALGDADICSEITSDKPGLKNDCIIAVALDKTDELVCEKIESRDAYVECYGKVAVKFGQDVICISMLKKFPVLGYIARDGCYYYYAKATSERETCSKILSDSLEETCLSEVP